MQLFRAFLGALFWTLLSIVVATFVVWFEFGEKLQANDAANFVENLLKDGTLCFGAVILTGTLILELLVENISWMIVKGWTVKFCIAAPFFITAFSLLIFAIIHKSISNNLLIALNPYLEITEIIIAGFAVFFTVTIKTLKLRFGKH